VATRPLIITTRLEHEAVRMLCEDLHARQHAEVRALAVDRLGLIDPDELNATLREHAHRTALVTIQWANNETGIIQPMQRIAQVCAANEVRLHTDATQLIGKRPVPFEGIDLLTLTGHKFHAPKGIGALIVRKGTQLARQTHGVQELERRGGTENTAGIVGLGIAADQAREWVSDQANIDRLAKMRDDFEQRLLDAIPGAASHISGADRLPNTISMGIPGADAEALVLALSERGVCVSAGAACASGSMEPSPVLRAMNIPHDLAGGTIRISLSRFTQQSELDEAFPHIVECAAFARA
jgi:cysteine desulfurase